MRRLAIISSIALAACLAACNSAPPPPPPANTFENVAEPDANVIGYDRCGEPIYQGQTNHPVNTPCR